MQFGALRSAPVEWKGEWLITPESDLRGAHLRGADLRGVDLSRSDLSGADLRDADLSGATLRSASLVGADLRNARLEQAQLALANLTEANLEGARLCGMQALSAKFRDANLVGADATGSLLAGVRFFGADLTRTVFRSATLRTARFEGAHLLSTSFRSADLDGASFAGLDLCGAHLSGAGLEHARFAGADMRGAGLPLDGNDPGSVVSTGVDLRRASLAYADFRGADLRNCRSDGVQQFGSASLPSGPVSADATEPWSRFIRFAVRLEPRHVPYLEQFLLAWVDEAMPRLTGAPVDEVVRQCVDAVPWAVAEAVRKAEEQPIGLAGWEIQWAGTVSAAVQELANRPWPRLEVLEVLQPSITEDWHSGRAAMSADERGGAAWVFMMCSLLQVEGDEPVPTAVIDALGHRLEHQLW